MVKKITIMLLIIFNYTCCISAQKKIKFHLFELKSHFSKSFILERNFDHLTFDSKLSFSGEFSYRYIRNFSEKFSIESGISLGAYKRKWHYEANVITADWTHLFKNNNSDYNPYIKIPLMFSYWYQLNNNYIIKGSFGPQFLLYLNDAILSNIYVPDSLNQYVELILSIESDYITNFKSGYSIDLNLLQKDKRNNYFVYGLSFNDKLGKGTRGMVTYYVNDEVIHDEMHGNNWYIGFSFGYMF